MEQKPLPGVIDTLSSGFQYINRIWWILVLPFAVDLFLWRGPRIALPNEVVAAIQAALGQGAEAASTPVGSSASQPELAALAAQLGDTNVLQLLTPSIGGVPTLAGALGPRGPLLDLTLGWANLALVSLIILAAGVFIGCVYLGAIAQIVRDGRVDLALLANKVGRYWLCLIGFFGLVLGASLAFSVPVGLMAVLASAISGALGSFVLAGGILLGTVGVLAATLYLFFVPEAVVISGVGPIKAAKNSANIVRRYPGPAIGLILLVTVISAGMQQVWGAVSVTWSGGDATVELLGGLAGILGNAYVASGLSAAAMVFYKSRMDASVEKKDLKSTEVVGGRGG